MGLQAEKKLGNVWGNTDIEFEAHRLENSNRRAVMSLASCPVQRLLVHLDLYPWPGGRRAVVSKSPTASHGNPPFLFRGCVNQSPVSQRRPSSTPIMKSLFRPQDDTARGQPSRPRLPTDLVTRRVWTLALFGDPMGSLLKPLSVTS
ncbi:hypothetical protein RRG08_010068 [Elysia crispata]|uniref:Uncharacterized protein n=1 Tax=Elysia crispata TaxID=231223 RepID=A0AAE1B8A7_9GAST|nr:hypothetical protein RRG08_010068 [Elysia crispata]